MVRFDIVSERLVLKPLGTEYSETAAGYSLDPESAEYMIFLPFGDREELYGYLRSTEEELSRQVPESYEFAIIYDGRHIGAAGIEICGGTCEFDWIIDREHRGHGFACEAAKAIMDCFHSHFGMSHFIARCDARNTASYRTMEKLGMTRTGENGVRRNRNARSDSQEYTYAIYL